MRYLKGLSDTLSFKEIKNQKECNFRENPFLKSFLLDKTQYISNFSRIFHFSSHANSFNISILQFEKTKKGLHIRKFGPKMDYEKTAEIVTLRQTLE